MVVVREKVSVPFLALYRPTLAAYRNCAAYKCNAPRRTYTRHLPGAHSIRSRRGGGQASRNRGQGEESSSPVVSFVYPRASFGVGVELEERER